MSVIREIYPILGEFVDEAPTIDWVEKIKSDNGEDNYLVNFDGNKLPMHCTKDPSKEAKDYAKTLKLTRTNVTVVVGMGAGYLCNALINKMDKKHHICVIEPMGYLIKEALHKFDFSEKLESRNLFIIPDSKGDVTEVLHHLNNKFVKREWNKITDKYVEKRREYKEVFYYVNELIRQIQCHTGTIANAGTKIADNDILNLPYNILRRGINELEGLYKNKPAVIVSTGPSLIKNIHKIKTHQDKVVVIAVGQALRCLLAYDVKPDFICSVDYGKVNMSHYNGLMDSDVPMVISNRSYHELFEKYQGPMFIVNNGSSYLQDKGELQQGGSVSHLCFGLAKKLGCNKIALIGLDLSLNPGNNQTHISLVDENEEWHINENNHICHVSVDPRTALGQVFDTGPITPVPGYYGDYVPSTVTVSSYLTAFEGMVDQALSEGAKIFNSTEGGARIKKAEEIRLVEFFGKYCKKNINKNKLNKLLTLIDDDDIISNTIDSLEKEVELIKQAKEQAKLTLATNKQIKKLINDKKLKDLMDIDVDSGFIELFEKNRKTSFATRILVSQIPLLSMALDGVNRQLYTENYLTKNDNNLTLTNEEVKEVAEKEIDVKQIKEEYGKADKAKRKKMLNTNKKEIKTGIKRNKLIMDAVIKECDNSTKNYNKSIVLLNKYSETKDERILIPKKADEELRLDDVKEYLTYGNFARPLIIARKIIVSDDEGPETTKEALKVEKDCLEVRAEVVRMIDEEAVKDEKANKHLLPQFNTLIEKSRDCTKELFTMNEEDLTEEYIDECFEKALKYILKAKKLFPDKELVKWAEASVSIRVPGRMKKAINLYEELVSDCPENLQYKYEYGKTLINGDDISGGIAVILEVMENTNTYDYFLEKIGDLYGQIKLEGKAIEAYNLYLESFGENYKVWEKKAVLEKKLGMDEEAGKSDVVVGKLMGGG